MTLQVEQEGMADSGGYCCIVTEIHPAKYTVFMEKTPTVYNEYSIIFSTSCAIVN
jgi:hypothetical protein